MFVPVPPDQGECTNACWGKVNNALHRAASVPPRSTLNSPLPWTGHETNKIPGCDSLNVY